MHTGYLLIDGNSIGNASNNAPKLSAGGQPTQAIYGFLKTLRVVVQSNRELKPVILWDGRGNWRYRLYPDYKAHRNKPPVTATDHKMAAMREEYRQQKPLLQDLLLTLGVPQLTALNYEADDLAGLLVERYQPLPTVKKILLVSGDKDWCQLVRAKVRWYDPIREQRVGIANFNEQMGFANTRQMVEYKALIGEPGDLGPGQGVGGIGPKTAKTILDTFGSVDSLFNMRLDGSIDPATGVIKDVDPKVFKANAKLLAFLPEDSPGRLTFTRNLDLINLTSTARPLPQGLVNDKGGFDPALFAERAGELAFHSILKKLDDWLQPFDPARLMEDA